MDNLQNQNTRMELKWPATTFGRLFILLIYISQLTFCKQVAIKIVDEPTNYGLNMGGYQSQDETTKLQMRIMPSNFSGPVHLKNLMGKCYSSVLESYKYELCPFSNMTQHEQSLRWNPYSGVLGVWQEWEIENNTFVAMVMGEGDSCGSLHRQTKILFKCGNDYEILNVTEPSTCNYRLVFSTPLVCHPHSMLVYPTLPKDLQQEWNYVEGQLQAEEITQQGYKKLLDKIFQKAGYMLAESAKKKVAEAAKHKEDQAAKLHEDTFDTLHQCQNEYKKLREQIEALKTVLRVNGLPDDIPETSKDDQAPAPVGDEQHDPYMDYPWMHDDDYGRVPDDADHIDDNPI